MTYRKLSDCIAPSFAPVYYAAQDDSPIYDIWAKGGRGSTKSSCIPTCILLGIMADTSANAAVFRQFEKTLRSSVMVEFERAMERLGVRSLWRISYTPLQIIYIPTGQQVMFSGLDDPEKIKSIKPLRGYFKYNWFEEASEMRGMNAIRNVRQTINRGGDIVKGFISYNPPKEPQHWINKIGEAEEQPVGRLVHSSTYLSVPRHWLGEQFIRDAEQLKASDITAYQHEYLGVPVGETERLIFARKVRVSSFTPHPDWGGAYFGADWGFSTDPNTLVKCWIEALDNGRERLYVEYAVFGYKTEIEDIPRLWSQVPDANTHKVFADCSRPDLISFMKRRRYSVEGAEKWDGSVKAGIDFLLKFDEIVIHERCQELIDEAMMYSYKFDTRTQEVLPVVVSKHDHGWDAIRYALSKYIKPKGGSMFARKR